jgi:hypothetical protein
VNALVALSDHGANALERRTLGRPVPAGSGAVFLPGEHQEGRFIRCISGGRIVDRHHLPSGEVGGDPTFGVRRQPVPDSGIGKGPPHHHLMITATGTVGVEIGQSHALAYEVASSR